MNEKRRVAPEVYDRAYLLSENTEGFDAYRRGELSFVKAQQLEMLALAPGVTLLEIGFGRGEFARHCALRGARVTAVDYSEAAVAIGRETLAAFPDADVRVADCKALPFPDGAFDRVYAGDVIEHQDFEDGVAMLREMWRVTKPGGFLFLHTAPNAVFMRFVLPLLKPILRRIDAAAVARFDEHMAVNAEVHVHEYGLLSLRRAARAAGLDAEVWIGADVLRSAQHRHTETLSQSPLVALAARLARLAPVRFFLGNDLYLKASKPAGG
jgi:ubiquinone/menaquinone biosynthesis C-methylase UbiE